MRTLSMRISSLCACSVHASVPDAYAQHAHQFLMRMLSRRISSWPVCSEYASVPDAYAQHALKGLRSLKLLHTHKEFRGPKWTSKYLLKIFYFNPKVALPSRLYGVKILKIGAIKISHLGTFKFCKSNWKNKIMKKLFICKSLKGLWYKGKQFFI
jgi:hypothetical protein